MQKRTTIATFKSKESHFMVNSRGSWPFGFINQQMTYLYTIFKILYFLVLSLDFLHTLLKSTFIPQQKYHNTFIVQILCFTMFRKQIIIKSETDFLCSKSRVSQTPGVGTRTQFECSHQHQRSMLVSLTTIEHAHYPQGMLKCSMATAHSKQVTHQAAALWEH